MMTLSFFDGQFYCFHYYFAHAITCDVNSTIEQNQSFVWVDCEMTIFPYHVKYHETNGVFKLAKSALGGKYHTWKKKKKQQQKQQQQQQQIR